MVSRAHNEWLSIPSSPCPHQTWRSIAGCYSRQNSVEQMGMGMGKLLVLWIAQPLEHLKKYADYHQPHLPIPDGAWGRELLGCNLCSEAAGCPRMHFTSGWLSPNPKKLAFKNAFVGMFSCVPPKKVGWKGSKYKCAYFSLGLYSYKDGRVLILSGGKAALGEIQNME